MSQKTTESPFVRRLVLSNYKSIRRCDIGLSRLTVFIGPNGAGKSNILDSLRFVSDSLRTSLEHAVRDRGGISEVRRRSKGHPTHFGVRLEMTLPSGASAIYAFRIGSSRTQSFTVQREMCEIMRNVGDLQRYLVIDGKLISASQTLQAAIEPDRLYLGSISAVPEFRPLYDALAYMGFYNINPDRMRDLQDPDASLVLSRDGGNISSVLRRLGNKEAKERIQEYLASIVPGIRGVDTITLGPKEALEFRQAVPSDENPWHFLAKNMSDGTLRALGVLVALFQGSATSDRPICLVGIEEPEIALHPAAASTLADAIIEASKTTQVLVTSHSPDLLDNEKIDSQSIMAVSSERGQTIVGPVDEAARRALHEGLYTAGELMRLQQIEPAKSTSQTATNQQNLFEPLSQK